MSHNLVSDLCLCVKAGINPLGNCRPAYPAAAYCGGAVSRGRCCRAPGTPCLPWRAQAIPLSLSLLPSLKRITFYSKAGQQTHYNEGWNRSTFPSLNIPLKTCLPSFPSRSPSLLCDGEAFSSPPLPIPVCFKLFTKTPSSFSFLIFLDPRCSHSLWFYFFSPYGELWEDNILSDHSQLETISQYLALLLFLQSLILVSALLFPFVSLRVFGLTLCIQPRHHCADSLNSPTLVTSCSVSGGTQMQTVLQNVPRFMGSVFGFLPLMVYKVCFFSNYTTHQPIFLRLYELQNFLTALIKTSFKSYWGSGRREGGQASREAHSEHGNVILISVG